MIYSLSISSAFIVTCSSDSTIRLWETISYAQISQFDIKIPCLAVTFNPDGSLFVAGFSDGSLQFFSTSLLKNIGKSQVFNCPVSCLCWISLEKLFVSSATGLVIEINAENWSRMSLTTEEVGMAGGQILSLDWKNGYLCAATDIGKISVWDNDKIVDIYNVFENPHGIEVDSTEESIKSTHKLYQQLSNVQSAAKFYQDELMICTASTLQYILFRNFISHNVIKRVVINHFPISLDILEDHFAVGCADNILMVYNNKTSETCDLTGNSSQVDIVSYDKSGLISASNGEILIYKFK